MTQRGALEAPVRFGANYTPSKDWMHSWLDFTPDDVRRDFAALAELGLDHVRIFPLWTILQPNRTLIRGKALDDVRSAVDIAGEFGMDASVDVIQGHLSSFDFVPAWLHTWHDRNMFTDPKALEGQVALVGRLGETLRDAPNFLGLTLGNETNQFSAETHPSPWPVTADEAERWITTLLDAAAVAAPGRPHVHSEYDAVWYMDQHGFTPAHASRLGAMTTIHSWIFNGTAQRYGGRSMASDRHAEYLIEVSRAFATDADRPIWLQEVGAPSNCLEPAEMPGFLEATVRSTVRTQNLWGVTWWCSHDVSRDLGDFPDLEYSLGLIDSEGEAKPIGRRLAEIIPELRERVAAPARETAIVIDVDEHDLPTSRTALSPGGAVFQAWVDACTEGLDPAFVTSRTADDADALAARGIRRLVRPEAAASGVERYGSVNTVVQP
ncbi:MULTISPECIES: glycosyl hydrolase [unclassified Microbacterium]|uniref:glycoside hydrolase 5 family protein n=1 Tax=unclassified Microbacterium TaxID=2609290 RepID=UPI000EAABC44|nr:MULTISPECIES: glycosyl hydrolase [unclassified Microbacterium]MBT2483793.1 glycosyl hydrolase [Microbacterium sp. ISL-108]RKN66779.1 glycosyl hydrolase [Microbacterium sp. CGR2]